MGLIIKFFLSGFREKSSLCLFLSLLGEQYSQRAVHWNGAMQAVPGRLLGLSGSILPSRETGLGNVSVKDSLDFGLCSRLLVLTTSPAVRSGVLPVWLSPRRHRREVGICC